MNVHMRIVQGGETVVDMPEWDGPIPRVGDYVFHPPQLGESSEPGHLNAIAGVVIQVIWRLYERPARKLAGKPEGFYPTRRPYVEIVYAS